MENRIKEVIKEKGYSMSDFAEILGMSRESLSRIIKNPSSPTLEKLSNALGVPVWQFFASPDEVKRIVCPHCGKEIKIKVE
jgi:transcriptional regulator with XRE-family HTH domain